MSRVIAATYEIEEEIGSGGSGVVYLGRHLRLGKKIVLKADKRTLSARPETLRREVDALKNLSHTYIPQVYDFVVDGDTVYTVMDYIEGESLDKALKRGQRFSQPQVIEWACQLLDALNYLHTRPPYGILHSDIKPANIMLTPQGDIRLIDFNIALALGEDGAVRVGYSQGYASPEHYGLDYSRGSSDSTLKLKTGSFTSKTEIIEDSGDQDTQRGALTGTGDARFFRADDSSRTAGKKTIKLDVRSDIYSLGATLYHLLTGVKPAKDAKDVIPVSQFGGSPALTAIIEKAMAPDPNDRYQTAAEMLWAFEHIHDSDPRAKRHKHRIWIAAGILAGLFLIGGACTLVGQGQMRRAAEEAEAQERAAKEAEELARSALAAIGRSEEAYRAGDAETAVSNALEALSVDTPYTGRAQLALTNALGVYNLSDGFKAHRTIELPSEPLDAVLSPEGTRLAAIYAYRLAVYDTETGERLAELSVEESALSDAVFLDENRIVYAAPGAVRAYDFSEGQELWSGAAGTCLARSADGGRVAAVYKDAQEAFVYDAATGAVVGNISFQGRSQRVAANDRFADPKDDLFSLNADGTKLAVSFSDGSLDVFDIRDPDGTLELLDPSDYTRFEGGFNGPYLAFSATSAADSMFTVVDTQEMVQTGGFNAQSPFLVQADESGVYLAADNILVKIHPVTGEQTEVAYTSEDIAGFRVAGNYALVATEDNDCSIFGAGALELDRMGNEYGYRFLQLAGPYLMMGSQDTPVLRLMKLESHEDADVFSYDPAYPHDEARLSADGSTVMLFRYDSFRLCGIDGTVLADVAIPDAEQVYDQQYRRDTEGSRLEVIYNDGTVRAYSAEDGSVLWERAGEVPDLTGDEEFYTDKWMITAPLHGTPAVYDRESGEMIRELEKDAYLTYATQVDDYVITEYISAEGERYGLLLAENGDTLARLPCLCDIVQDRLVFDYPSGVLRQSRIYSLQELTALAEK